MSQATSDAIRDTLSSPNCCDSNFEAANVVDGLYRVAGSITFAAKHLGKADASDPRGAIEYLGQSIEEGCSKVASAISELAEAVDRLKQ